MNSVKRYSFITLSIFIIFAFWFMPVPDNMTAEGMKVIGIFLGILLLWLTVSIDWPSLAAMALLGLIPAIGMKTVFLGTFGNQAIVFLMITFLCTFALTETPFIKRCAIGFITSRIARRGPWSFTTSFFGAVLCIGCFMSPSVVFLVFLPIAEQIFSMLNLQKGNKVANMLTMGLAFTVSISAGMTPIAHVFSIMAMSVYENATGQTIGYAQYMAFAIPIGLLLTITLLLFCKFILRPNMSVLENVDYDALEKEVPPITKHEIIALVIFALVVALWLLPSVFMSVFPGPAKAVGSLGIAFPPIIGVILYCIISIDGKPLLHFAEGMKRGIPWSVVIMAAGTLAIGNAMMSPQTGLTTYLVSVLHPLIVHITPTILLWFICIWAAIQTNFSTNMVTVSVVTAVSIQLCVAIGGSLHSAAVVAIIGMLASFAFATPPAMPHIALSIGTGWTDLSSVMRYGGLLMIASVILGVVIGYPIAIRVM